MISDPMSKNLYSLLYRKIMYFHFGAVDRAWLAQSVERWTFNPTVAGSSPASGLILLLFALLVTHLTFCSRRRILIHSMSQMGKNGSQREKMMKYAIWNKLPVGSV